MITTTQETITPSIAKKMLERNKNNRPLKESDVDYLVRQMKNSEFHMTGESIKFSIEDDLLDGQHRLSAIVKSGVTIKTLVTRGLDADAFKFMDTGRSRSAGDVLAVSGVGEYNAIAAMIKFIVTFKQGRFNDAAHHRGTSQKMSNGDVSDYYQKHKDSIELSIIKARAAKSKIISTSQLAAWHYIFKTKELKESDEFIARLGDGVNLAQKSPIHVLRERLMQDKISTLKLSPYSKTALIVKAWNAFRKGKQISRLHFDPTREDFPKPI